MARTVLIVDDHDGFRSTARAVLQAGGFEVVAEAATGHDALAEAVRVEPQVVLLDVLLPDTDGFEVALLLAAQPEPPAVVLVSTRERTSYAHRLLTSPVRGFLNKRELSASSLADLLESR